MNIGDVYIHRVTKLAIIIEAMNEKFVHLGILGSIRFWPEVDIKIVENYYDFSQKLTDEQIIKDIIE